MQPTTTNQNGFAIELTDETDLGQAMLIAESEDGDYEPIAIVSTIREARELARDDFRNRMKRVERDDTPPCPYTYKVWARGIDGEHRIACQISA
jgi:hypothetical protein